MTRHANCNWPDCQDYDERCMTGINIPCAMIEREPEIKRRPDPRPHPGPDLLDAEGRN